MDDYCSALRRRRRWSALSTGNNDRLTMNSHRTKLDALPSLSPHRTAMECRLPTADGESNLVVRGAINIPRCPSQPDDGTTRGGLATMLAEHGGRAASSEHRACSSLQQQPAAAACTSLLPAPWCVHSRGT